MKTGEISRYFKRSTSFKKQSTNKTKNTALEGSPQTTWVFINIVLRVLM